MARGHVFCLQRASPRDASKGLPGERSEAPHHRRRAMVDCLGRASLSRGEQGIASQRSECNFCRGSLRGTRVHFRTSLSFERRVNFQTRVSFETRVHFFVEGLDPIQIVGEPLFREASTLLRRAFLVRTRVHFIYLFLLVFILK
jgi:hypothetical protein